MDDAERVNPIKIPYYKVRDKAKRMKKLGWAPGLVVDGRPDPKNPEVIIYNEATA